MLAGTLRFSPLQPNEEVDNIEVVNSIRSKIGLGSLTESAETSEPFKYFIEGMFVNARKSVNLFRFRLNPDLKSRYPDAFNYFEEEFQFHKIEPRTLEVNDKKIGISQFFYEGDTSNPVQNYSEQNRDNLTYLGYIIQTIRKVYINKEGTVTGDAFNYVIDFNKEEIKVHITVKDGKIDEVEFSDGYSSLVLQEQYAFKVEGVKNLHSVGLKEEHLETYSNTQTAENSIKNELLLKFKTQKGFFNTIEELLKAHPEKDISWTDSVKHYIVTPKNFEKVMNYLNKFKLLAVDTETTGLEVNFKSRIGKGDTLVGLVISPRKGESYYFPIAHSIKSDMLNVTTGKRGVPTFKQVKDFLQKHFKEMFTTKQIACHNTEFDWRVLWVYSISMNVVIDTMYAIGLTLVDHGKLKGRGLKYLAEELLNRTSLDISDLKKDGVFGNDEYTFADLNAELTKYYACPDADNTISLVELIEDTKLLDEYEMRELVRIETQFEKVKGYAKFNGIRLDLSNAKELIKKTEKSMEKALDGWLEEVAKLGGNVKNGSSGVLNPGSSKDRVYAFYEVAKCEPIFKTDKGGLSVSADAVKAWTKQYNNDGTPKYPLAVKYKEYNEYATLLKSFLNKNDEFCDEDGFFFSDYSNLVTGRISTQKPAYQNFSDDVKTEIRPRKGFYMFDYDYSSIESRIIASLSGQTDLIEAMFDPNTDWHRIQAARMFKVLYELVTEKLRGEVKPFNFGLPYGMSEWGMAQRRFGDTSEISLAKARKEIDDYFASQPMVKLFFQNLQKSAVKNMYSRTYYGRRRYYSYDHSTKRQIMREGGNAPIQGMGADVYKRQIGLFFDKLEKNDLLDKVLVVGFIHDEALLEISHDVDLGVLFPMLVKTLEYRNPKFCPFFIGCGFGGSWYEAKKTEIPVDLQYELLENPSELTELSKNVKDGTEMNKWLVKRLVRFNKEYVEAYVTNLENDGKAITPVVHSRLIESLKSLGYKGKDLDKLDLTQSLEIYYKECNVEKVITIYTAEEYLALHPETAVSSESNKEVYEQPEEKTDEQREDDMMLSKIENFGYYLYNPMNDGALEDSDLSVSEMAKLKKVYINIKLKDILAENKDLLNTEGKGYELMFSDLDNNKLYKTKFHLENTNTTKLRRLFKSKESLQLIE